mmetsp:Transcript_56720/g.164515  ORF Transcript_56720/g.164515 Transcript_56720/m.164515 type:complete len:295 (+) Transcript_56720:832-1716(+)
MVVPERISLLQHRRPVLDWVLAIRAAVPDGEDGPNEVPVGEADDLVCFVGVRPNRSQPMARLRIALQCRPRLPLDGRAYRSQQRSLLLVQLMRFQRRGPSAIGRLTTHHGRNGGVVVPGGAGWKTEPAHEAEAARQHGRGRRDDAEAPTRKASSLGLLLGARDSERRRGEADSGQSRQRGSDQHRNLQGAGRHDLGDVQAGIRQSFLLLAQARWQHRLRQDAALFVSNTRRAAVRATPALGVIARCAASRQPHRTGAGNDGRRSGCYAGGCNGMQLRLAPRVPAASGTRDPTEP